MSGSRVGGDSPDRRPLTAGQIRALRAIALRMHGRYRGNSPRGFAVSVCFLERAGLAVERIRNAYLPEHWELTAAGHEAMRRVGERCPSSPATTPENAGGDRG